MNTYLKLSVRRTGGRHYVMARDRDLEHTHHQPFRTKKRAWQFLDRVRKALDDGRDLNLAHWEYTGP